LRFCRFCWSIRRPAAPFNGAGIVSDNPRPSRTRRLQGSHRATPRTIVISDLSARSDPDPLAGPTTGPRSRLAAFPRPPSVPPCGLSSGFPRSGLAALARGSARYLALCSACRLLHTLYSVPCVDRGLLRHQHLCSALRPSGFPAQPHEVKLFPKCNVMRNA
jgi:hypothetical protein